MGWCNDDVKDGYLPSPNNIADGFQAILSEHVRPRELLAGLSEPASTEQGPSHRLCSYGYGFGESRCAYGRAFLSDSKSKSKGDARPHNASDANKGTDEAMPLNAQLHVAYLTAKGSTTHHQKT
ncbi:hypothetical protein BJX68DRAFT_262994 [Aspergillus pseudodeflectus]|uniref:Uncharacterized protein n=1 Tax=Aspergillus pseudodeflectus TaxID=176178 RepID=A0ABR4L1R0_9EURO